MLTETTPDLLTKDDVCARLNIAHRTLETMVKEGRFAPAVRMGKRACWSEKSKASINPRLVGRF